METLVQIAKRLGIKPNPEMTRQDWSAIFNALEKELGYRPLPSNIYDQRKHVKQNFNIEKCSDNIRFCKTHAEKGVRIHGQYDESVSLDEDAIFVWHSASKPREKATDRFQIGLRLDDPKLPECLKRLDDFIIKYKSRYKITDLEHLNRSDQLNVYMHTPITPQITKELYSILKPFLKEEHHDQLDGFPIKNGGKEIKGIKYGAEPFIYDNLSEHNKQCINVNIVHHILKFPEQSLFRSKLGITPHILEKNEKELMAGKIEPSYIFTETTSLGQLSASIQYLDLIYYLAGKEGQNPFQMGNQFGFSIGDVPKIWARKIEKSIDIADTSLTETIKKGTASYDKQIKFQLGDTPPRKISEAVQCGRYLGTVIINTPEGMVEQVINVPFGVKSVDSSYIMTQLKDPKAARNFSEHKEGDNILTLGCGVAHPLSTGCVLITDPSSFAKFEGKIAEGKHFRLQTSPNIHVNLEKEEITIKNAISSSKGMEPR